MGGGTGNGRSLSVFCLSVAFLKTAYPLVSRMIKPSTLILSVLGCYTMYRLGDHPLESTASFTTCHCPDIADTPTPLT
jgi:hypothetical protein